MALCSPPGRIDLVACVWFVLVVLELACRSGSEAGEFAGVDTRILSRDESEPARRRLARRRW